jgi:hypothetical protein
VNAPDLTQALQLGQVTANRGRRDHELAGQLLDTHYVVYAQDFSQPFEAFRGEFSRLTGFQFVTVTMLLVMLHPRAVIPAKAGIHLPVAC